MSKPRACQGQYGAPCGQPVTHVYHGLQVRRPLCTRCAADVAAMLRQHRHFGRPERVRVVPLRARPQAAQ